ncbi:MAG: hypothetical protein RR573_10325, partial [Oscillospiraceae bacterium]
LEGLASGEFCRINDARLSDARPANGGNANTLDNLDSTAFCLTGDSRLSNARPSSDVYSWAKQSAKPSYNASEVGLGNVSNAAQSQAAWWNWSGLGGQPTWLWGGNNANDYYVYNPANFSVNYANSAGNIDGGTY